MSIRTRSGMMLCIAVLGLSVSTTSCALFGKKTPVAPILIPPAPQPTPAQKPQPIEPPPQIETTETRLPEVGPPLVQEPKPPAPPPKTEAVVRPAPAPKPAEPAPSEPPPPTPPRLTQILSPDQQADYVQQLEEAIRSAQQNLAKIAGRKLTSGQEENRQRAELFLKQANEYRQTDLVTARGLAQRASALAEDIWRSLQ